MTGTPGQTVGPFFHVALPRDGDRHLVDPGSPGAVLLHGTVRDGAGEPVPDAVVEVWQADAAGAVPREGAGFAGWGRCATDGDGHWSVTTVAPGGVDGTLPFFALTILARGLLDRLFTRAYLPLGGAAPDAVLRGAGERASTLVCLPDERGLRFDVRLQGDGETVFLGNGGDSAP